MTCLRTGPGGEIALPESLRTRYAIGENTPIRIIETRNGILLVPLTDEAMAPALEKELKDWQSLGAASWELFGWNDGNP
ncbi:MAG: hypothetical protein HY735_31810 [Verrucomicrobia bacterium]|nr:hypothetical protein [Verrucomicrobiota bacterium]